MIDTRKEAQLAVIEIQDATGWSLREIARKSGIHVATLSRLMQNKTGATPYESTRKSINAVLLKIKKKRKA